MHENILQSVYVEIRSETQTTCLRKERRPIILGNFMSDTEYVISFVKKVVSLSLKALNEIVGRIYATTYTRNEIQQYSVGRANHVISKFAFIL